VLRRMGRRVSQPRLQLKQGERLTCVKELRGDRGAGPACRSPERLKDR
jgi:hypothetical protein